MADNIYKKMQLARVKLQEIGLKKSGKNAHLHYDYYELSDFIPAIQKICNEVGLFTHVIAAGEISQLTITNIDNTEETLIFKMDSVEVKLNSGQTIQQIGAAQTYYRRYLYMTAFEICEPDVFEIQNGDASKQNYKQPKQYNKSQPQPVQNNHAMLVKIGEKAKKAELSSEDVINIIKSKYNKEGSKQLSAKECSDLFNNFDKYLDEFIALLI